MKIAIKTMICMILNRPHVAIMMSRGMFERFVSHSECIVDGFIGDTYIRIFDTWQEKQVFMMQFLSEGRESWYIDEKDGKMTHWIQPVQDYPNVDESLEVVE